MLVRAPLVFDVQNMFLPSWASPTVCVQFSVLECTPHAREVVLTLKRILHIFHCESSSMKWEGKCGDKVLSPAHLFCLSLGTMSGKSDPPQLH